MRITDEQITLRRPDDFHLHLRQGELLSAVVPYTAKVFGRALVMPNTVPPVSRPEEAERYRVEIESAAKGLAFKPLLAFKAAAGLESVWTADRLRGARERGVVAAKYYPEGATTNAEVGIRDPEELYPLLENMQGAGTVLAIHGEVPTAFCLDREAAFLPLLARIAADFPRLRIVLEHLSTAEAVAAVEEMPDTVAATITLHHLMLTLDDLIGGLLAPHHFCKPVVKRPQDRAALRTAATSGNPKFFFGSDSAPHARSAKESGRGSAGVFSAPVALPALAELFEAEGRLDRLEEFVAGWGTDFYRLPRSTDTIRLEASPWRVPDELSGVVPFLAGRTLRYRAG